jgi:SEC-C motif domain protein
MSRAVVCPCRVRDGSGQFYDECCGPFHLGFKAGLHAPTPEALMRSRYSAYALAQPGYPRASALLTYLNDTWHSITSPGELELFPRQWIGLKVVHADASAEAGVVEFMAYYRENGKAEILHELSRFLKIEDRWVYLDAQAQDQQSEGSSPKE